MVTGRRHGGRCAWHLTPGKQGHWSRKTCTDCPAASPEYGHLHTSCEPPSCPHPENSRKLLLLCYFGKIAQGRSCQCLSTFQTDDMLGQEGDCQSLRVCVRETVLRNNVGRKSRVALQATSRIAHSKTTLCSRSLKHCPMQNINATPESRENQQEKPQ